MFKITEGIKITVESYYQPDYSNPANNEFMFAYRITIENSNAYPVQLLSRHWYIADSNGSKKEVEGEGVVGVQPKILPGEKYQYVSGCNLRSDMGTMAGTYTMLNLYTKQTFEVQIPQFKLLVPAKLN